MIPINRIKNILRRLEQEGEFKEAYLGIDGFDNYALKYMNIDYKSETGIYVDKVDQTSPAFEKIYEGDIITQIDDLEIAKMQDINEYLYTKNPKDKIKIHLIRGTKELEVTCELGSKK